MAEIKLLKDFLKTKSIYPISVFKAIKNPKNQKSIEDYLGDTDLEKGTVQEQLDSKPSNEELNSYLSNKQDSIVNEISGENIHISDSVKGDVVVSKAVKNLLPYPYEKFSTDGSDISFTVNEDGSITANGTSSISNYFHIYLNKSLDFLEDGKTYCVSGTPTDGSFATCSFYLYDNTTKTMYSDATDKPDKFFTYDSSHLYTLSCKVTSGVTANNVTFYPMLEEGEVSHNYVPYSGYEIKTCGKNLLQNNGNDTNTTYGVTFTKNSDGSVTLNGTATGTPTIYRLAGDFINKPFKLRKGKYIVSGLNHINNDSGSIMFLQITSDANSRINIRNNNEEFTLNEDTSFYEVALRCTNGSVYDNVIDYPMIRRVEDTDDTYEPYKESIVSITPDTVFPLYGLKSFDGVTNILNDYNSEMSVQYALNETGIALLSTSGRLDKLESNFEGGVNEIVTAINTASGAVEGDENYLDGNSSPSDIVNVLNSNLGGKFLGFYSITNGSKKHVFDSAYNKILLIVHAGQSAELTPSISVTFNGISNSLIHQTTWTYSRHYIEKIYELTNVKESDVLNIQCNWEGCYYLIQMW